MTPQQGTFRVSTDFEIPVLDMSSRWQWFKLTGQESGTQFRRVCGLAQLADTLTKYNDRKALLQFSPRDNFGSWCVTRPSQPAERCTRRPSNENSEKIKNIS